VTNLPPVDRTALISTRRDLHQHPELGFEEIRTARLVADRLRGLGYQVETGVGRTGVVGRHEAGATPCVLLRADMDALPVEETGDVPYRSVEVGKMHACGHDGHVAMGLEAARRLQGVRLPRGGTIKFAFQPAEETGLGAQAMIAAGVLEAPAVDAAFGIHLWNDLPVGSIGIMAGPVMASVDEFEITIVGRGGHAAAPHQTVDPVLVAAHVITGLQSLVSRRRNPFEEAVLSVTHVAAGHAFNVIPGRAELRGTVRTFGGTFYAGVPALLEDTVQGVARAFGATAEVRYRRVCKPTVNEAVMTRLMADAAVDVVGSENVVSGVRTMGGEDMSFFLDRVPGCFAFVGASPLGRPGAPHHSSTFDIDEDALVIGTELLARTALRFLDRPRV
jgi:amidohydrolase